MHRDPKNHRDAEPSRTRFWMLTLLAVVGLVLFSWRGVVGGTPLQDNHARDTNPQATSKSGEKNHLPAVDAKGHAVEPHDGHAHVSDYDYFLGSDHLISHTQDMPYFELPSMRLNAEDKARKIWIPRLSPWTEEAPLMKQPAGRAGEFLGPVTFQPTKFILLQLLAAVLVGGTFIWLARKIATDEPPRGRRWNLLEAFVVYLRDEVAKPAIGVHDYKAFMPFLLTLFFFILTMNLMGMFPLLGTPTGNISVTTALALSVFALVLFVGMKRLGVVGFWKAQVPHLGVKGPFGVVLNVGIWCIEVFGLFIKHMVLAVRLFANMFAGHLVLAVFVGFIGATLGSLVAWIVWPAAIGGSVAISLLELLVAFIQAYVFTFLAALFIGAAVHPH